ncbi:rhomboid family intramembrane serine protease [Mangrovibacterium marinum]|uniref:Membrane associated rhomboid family serine protease n=1 Tax=Mangrovibacterium marinum TaxID=1639118 RepID=A0A2T5BZR0_9BACT|nr:rhomboid family intramembrane serine protease [Mangrovibacterium marinum]PTN07774.1 membrane associated rhomboid family serine protease [Mangrovibacterium marinum]
MPLFNYYPNQHKPDHELDKKIFRYSMVFPALFLLGFWLVFLVENILGDDFARLGIFPRTLEGLTGILLSPFIHASLKHIVANSIPFFVLAVALFYFYRSLAWRIFLLIYLFSGICVWIGAREAWHIGASGLIYGLGSFLFFSGLLRNDVKLLTISIVVVFLYGGMFWGIFPIEPGISWESHLWGGISGLVLSVFYRKQGPQRSRYEWEDEPEDDATDLSEEPAGEQTDSLHHSSESEEIEKS